MVELEKIRALTTENFHTYSVYQIINIFSILYNAHVIPKNQDKFVFYSNNYID